MAPLKRMCHLDHFKQQALTPEIIPFDFQPATEFFVLDEPLS